MTIASVKTLEQRDTVHFNVNNGMKAKGEGKGEGEGEGKRGKGN